MFSFRYVPRRQLGSVPGRSACTIAFQGRNRLCISPSHHSCSTSAFGNPHLLPSMSLSPQDSTAVSVRGYPAWPEAPHDLPCWGKTHSPPPSSGVSMLLDPFQSIQCHLLASPLISPHRSIALLRASGNTP